MALIHAIPMSEYRLTSDSLFADVPMELKFEIGGPGPR